jgi:hypothetical protein
MDRSGSIVGISVVSDAARTNGTATFQVYTNNSATGLIAVLDGTNTQYSYTIQASGLDTFAAGALLDVRVSTTSGGGNDWAPTNADVEVSITIKYD